jgi:hypothetical protein
MARKNKGGCSERVVVTGYRVMECSTGGGPLRRRCYNIDRNIMRMCERDLEGN